MSRNDGFIMIAVLMITVVVAVLVLGTTFTTTIDRSITANQQGATEAYYVAQAGLSKYKTIAFQTYRYYLAKPDKYSQAIQDGNPACGNYLNIGLDLDRDGTVGGAGDLLDGQTIGPFAEGRGTYTIRYEVSGRYIVLTAVANVGRSRSTVQLVAEPSNSGLLNYALFAGPGQSSKFLNGNAEIYGGVHIVGDPAAPDSKVIDANGNFRQYNYYSSADLDAIVKDSKINGDELRSFLSLNSHEQKDLCAQLRVENGVIDLGGSSAVGGDPNNRPAPRGFKTNLEGVHIGTGPDSLSGGTLGRIEADAVGAFDLQSPPDFPDLDDPNLDLVQVCDDAGKTTWRSCLHATPDLYVFGAAGPASGSCRMSGGSPITDLSNWVKSDTLTFDDASIDCTSSTLDADGNPVSGFRYTEITPTPRKGARYRLEVFGITNFRGLDLAFAKDVEVRFANRATFFVEESGGKGGDVTVSGDLLPSNSFPNRDVLGMIMDGTFTMTGDQVNITDTPKQQVAMGLFYAGEGAQIEKGGIVFGTIIAPSFTFSSGKAGQTSKIVQVPGLSYGSAPGFNQVNDAATATFEIASYERR